MKRKKMCHWINTSKKLFKKDLVFLVIKILKYINKNLSLKLEMVFYNRLSHLKPMSHFFPMLPNIPEPSSCVRNSPPPPSLHKQITKNLIIL